MQGYTLNTPGQHQAFRDTGRVVLAIYGPCAAEVGKNVVLTGTGGERNFANVRVEGVEEVQAEEFGTYTELTLSVLRN